MRTYEALQALTFKSGRFALTSEQLRRRKHVVRHAGEGVFEPIDSICFKRGETIVADIDYTKEMHSFLRLVDAPYEASVSLPLDEVHIEARGTKRRK